MKMLDVFARPTPLQAAKELFFQTWRVATRTVLRNGPHTASWIICADLDGSGELPRTIVAAGVCDTEGQARRAMRRHYERWILTGTTGMSVGGRASW